MCSNFVNHSQINNQRNWKEGRKENPYGHLTRKRIFTLRMIKTFMRALKIIRKMAMGMIWNC